MPSLRLSILFSVVALCCQSAVAQFEFNASSTYVTSSSFTDEGEKGFGSGNLSRTKLSVSGPVALRYSTDSLPTLWMASVNTSYAYMDNHGDARRLNPTDVFNASVNGVFIRQLSKRTGIVATLGVGLFCSPDYVRWQSLLFNGGCAFLYKARENLIIGGGAGLTNSYGIPMVIPVLFLKWEPGGRFDLNVNLTSGLKITAGMKLGKHLHLGWTLIETEAMSAVFKQDGINKIYSSLLVNSHLTPTWSLSKRSSIYLDLGCNFMRTSKVSPRKVRYFFSSKKGWKSRRFEPAFRISCGYRYKF